MNSILLFFLLVMPLANGTEAILHAGEPPQDLAVAPVATDPKKKNAWGQKQ